MLARFFDFGPERGWVTGPEDVLPVPCAAPGAGSEGRLCCMFCSGAWIGGFTPFDIMGPFGFPIAPGAGPGPAPGAVAAGPFGVALYPLAGPMPFGPGAVPCG